MNYEKPNLAIFGGKPHINHSFNKFNTIGSEEKNAAIKKWGHRPCWGAIHRHF